MPRKRNKHYTRIDDAEFHETKNGYVGYWYHTLVYPNRPDTSGFKTEERTLKRIMKPDGARATWSVSSDCWRNSDGKRRITGRHKHYDFGLAPKVDAIGRSEFETARIMHELHGLGTGHAPHTYKVEQYVNASPTQRAIRYAGTFDDLEIELEDGRSYSGTVTSDLSRHAEKDTYRLEVEFEGIDGTYYILIEPTEDDTSFKQPHFITEDVSSSYGLTMDDVDSVEPIVEAKRVNDEPRAGKYGVVPDWTWGDSDE